MPKQDKGRNKIQMLTGQLGVGPLGGLGGGGGLLAARPFPLPLWAGARVGPGPAPWGARLPARSVAGPRAALPSGSRRPGPGWWGLGGGGGGGGLFAPELGRGLC